MIVVLVQVADFRARVAIRHVRNRLLGHVLVIWQFSTCAAVIVQQKLAIDELVVQYFAFPRRIIECARRGVALRYIQLTFPIAQYRVISRARCLASQHICRLHGLLVTQIVLV